MTKVPSGLNLVRALGWTLAIELVALATVAVVTPVTQISSSQANGAVLLIGLAGVGLVTALRKHDPDWQCWVLAILGPLGVLIALWRSGNRRDKHTLATVVRGRMPSIEQPEPTDDETSIEEREHVGSAAALPPEAAASQIPPVASDANKHSRGWRSSAVTRALALLVLLVSLVGAATVGLSASSDAARFAHAQARLRALTFDFEALATTLASVPTTERDFTRSQIGDLARARANGLEAGIDASGLPGDVVSGLRASTGLLREALQALPVLLSNPRAIDIFKYRDSLNRARAAWQKAGDLLR